jgi:type IV pilus biogenesis protein CpaD/CtpE
MKKLLFVAAACAVTAACHNRANEETGAAPATARNDTTAITHVIDSTRTGPPGVAGRPGNATVTPDSVGIDSTAVRDSTARNNAASPVSTPQDTLGPRDITPGAADSTRMQGDSTMRMQGDSTMPMQGDSTMHHGAADSTRAK